MTIAGFVMLFVGLALYVAAFGRGAGPTMGDDTLQATMFTLGTLLMFAGFIFLVVI